jgi:transcriptional regulator with XRE-family HTH domain
VLPWAAVKRDQADATIAIGSVDDAGDLALAAAALTVEELLGRAILRLRLYRGWSQRDLERRARVDQSTISRLETGGRANVGARRLCSVLEALGVADIVMPASGTLEPTTLELMLYGDPWQRAGREAERRVARRRALRARSSRARTAGLTDRSARRRGRQSPS